MAFNEDQPRDDSGRWSDGGTTASGRPSQGKGARAARQAAIERLMADQEAVMAARIAEIEAREPGDGVTASDRERASRELQQHGRELSPRERSRVEAGLGLLHRAGDMGSATERSFTARGARGR